MSYEVLKPAELLSAYLSHDVAPDERIVVERLLADDPVAFEQLEELRELCALLKEGNCEVSQGAIDTLRRAVFHKIQEKQIKALVTVSVTGDLSAAEKTDVETYLNTHPAAQIAQRQAAEVSALLKSGNKTADNALADKLRAKLKSALPPAAMTPFNKSATVAVKIDTASGRSERPTLRVFVKPENPWKKRLIMASGIAALLALAVTARALWREPRQPDIATNPLEKNGVPERNDQVANVVPPRSNDVPVPPKDVPGPENPVVPENKLAIETPPKAPPIDNLTPREVPKKEVVIPEAPKISPDPRKIAPPDDKIVVPDKIKTPDPATPEKLNNIAPQINNFAPEAKQQPIDGQKGGPPIFQPGVGPSNSPLTPNSGASFAPGPGVKPPKVDPNDPQFDVTNEQNPDPIAPQNGVGTVGSIKGTVVRVTNGDKVFTPQQTNEIKSGSTIETDGNSMLSLILPGDGRLYINKATTVTVGFGATSTTVSLVSGEVYYFAGQGGTMTLSAGAVQVTKVSEAVIKLLGGRLIVLNFGKAPLSLGKLNVGSSEEASAAANGGDAPKKHDTFQLADNWRGPILAVGEPGLKVPKSKRGR